MRLKGFAISVLAACFLFPGNSHGYTAVYSFGDSLSDTGNFPSLPILYYNGRFSNGPVWVEHLAGKFGLPYTAANNRAVSNTTSAQALARIQATGSFASAGSALFTLWTGGNDFLDNLSQGANDAFWNGLVSMVASNLAAGVTLLYDRGARAIVAPNMVDLGKIPRLRNGYSVSFQNFLSGKVVLYNTLLAAELARIRLARPDLQIFEPDLFARYNELLAAPASYGFTRTDIGVLQDGGLSNKGFTGPGQFYVFWDSIHPTTRAHALLADWVFADIDASPPRIRLVPSFASFELQLFNLRPGKSYILQCSPDLSGWSDVQSLPATLVNHILPAGLEGANTAFYRLKHTR